MQGQIETGSVRRVHQDAAQGQIGYMFWSEFPW